MVITGNYLDFVGAVANGPSVTVGGTPAAVVAQTNTRLVIITPPHSAASSNPIVLFDIDNAAPGGTALPGGGFRYDLTPPTELPIPNLGIFIVGPSEGIDLEDGSITNSSNINCIGNVMVNVTTVVSPVNAQFGVQAARVDGSFTCTLCQCPAQQPNCDRNGTISFRLINTAAPTTLKKLVTRNVDARYGGTGSCSKTF